MKNLFTPFRFVAFTAASLILIMGQQTNAQNARSINNTAPAAIKTSIANSSLGAACTGIGIVTVPDVGTSKAIIDWTSTAIYDSIHVQYNEWGNPTTTTVTVIGTPTNKRYVLNGLTDNTRYDVTISTFCNAGTQSPWSNVVSFATLNATPRLQNPNAEFSAAITPNPATTNARVMVSSNGSGNCQLSVYDVSGKEKMIQNVELSESLQAIELDLTNLPKGIYLVKVVNNFNSTVQRLIIN